MSTQREIKFRAWDKKLQMWASNGWHLENTGRLMLHSGPANVADTDYVVMQYTGLRDKNALEDIYEGDILAPDGTIAGNRYEHEDLLKDPAYLLVEGVGTGAWRSAEQAAMERGCTYSK